VIKVAILSLSETNFTQLGLILQLKIIDILIPSLQAMESV